MKSLNLIVAVGLLGLTFNAKAQNDGEEKAFEVYGFIMTDIGYNFNQIDPSWYDVVRPTKLPIVENQFGTDGNVYFSVRQTRFGTKAWFPTSLGKLFTQFEWELFGTGVDAGQTTLRLRHAYAELGKFGAGQYWSPFMDIDVFPNTVEYWGPSGMVFFRNIQFRYMPIQGDSRLTIALERPGASADQGIYVGRPELANVNSKFSFPDLSAEYRHAGGFGYVELAGIVRNIAWEDQGNDPVRDLSDNVLGWGLNLSSNINFTNSLVGRFQAVYGEGIANYMNDATNDIGIENNFTDPVQPVLGKALPVLGLVAFLDQKWSDKFTSSVGYSSLDITNTETAAPEAFAKGQYIIGNLLYYPTPNAMMGIEVQYGSRENEDPDLFESTDILKLQFSFKYNFSQAWYRKTSM
jgi:hypothetical protein